MAQHIALVLHDFSSGGSERIAVRLANAWAASGRQVTLFCGNQEGPLRPMVSDRITVVPILPRIARGPASRMHLGRALAGQIRGCRPDVVVGPGNYHAPILRTMIDDLDWDRPAVVCKLSNPLVRGDRSPLKQALFNWQFKRMSAPIDTLVAMSGALAAEATVLLKRDDIACCGEPNLDALPVVPEGRGPGRTVLCVGRLARQKNFALALDAFARAAPDLRLIVLGEGEEEAMLKARAAALGIADRVAFKGYVHDVPRYLAEADALLCTSLFEGYPAALVEALAAGLPVISTPCSIALPEILRDPSFGAIAPADPDALATALDAVVGEGRRPAPGPLAELGRRHQIGPCAEQWLAVLDRAVTARTGAMVG